MTGTTLIAVPCRVITLQMELGTDSGASTLEALVLEAVAGGRRTVKDLGELFSLPHRLMLDVVHSLWSRGFLAVDFATHALESTQAAEAILGGQEGQKALATTVQPRKFLFDPVTATVLRFKHGYESVPRGALEMPPVQGISEEDLPQAELLRVVRQAVEHDRPDDDRSRVLNVSFANPVLSPPEAVRWRTVETVVKRAPGTGLLTAVPVKPPPGWGRRAQELFQSHVTGLVRTRPDSRFAKLLTNRQVLEGDPAESLRVVMQGLDRLAAELTTAPDTRVPGLHEELSRAALQVLEELEEARRGRCQVSSAVAGAGVEWAVSHLIENATRQVVLALPDISYDHLQPLLPALELAAKRGVTLVFLWGSTPYAKLERRVSTALFDLQARFPRHVLLERRSSSCAASVVVCDDQAAYVGSRSVLSDDTGVGVLVKSLDDEDGTPPECVTELLSWARQAYLYWHGGREIALTPAEFGRREGAADPAPNGGRHRAALPRLDDTWDEDAAASRTAWAADWGRLLQRLRASVDESYRGEPVVRAVWGGRYVDLVQRLISEAAERLAVLDDRADPEACGDQLAQRLTELRDKGVVVHLQHPSAEKGARQTGGRYGELQKRLAAERTLRNSRARARAILSDHEVVVGSDHPLGDRATLPARGPAPHQLGLHITGTAFTAHFARELGIPDWFGDDGAELPDYLPSLSALGAVPVDDDPWTVLASRRARAEPADVLRRESAALLLTDPDGGAERHAWAEWLLHDAWARGAFMEAYLLAPLLGGPDRMSVDLAAVAVPMEHGPLGFQLYASTLELDTAPAEHRTVALAGAIAEMLLQGSSYGADACELLLEADGLGRGLPAAWTRLGAAALACFQPEPAPLPLSDAREWAARQEKLTDSSRQWSRLAVELDDFKQIRHHFAFQDGQKLHRELFRPGRALAVLKEAAEHASPPGPRAEDVTALPRTEKEVRTLMDQLATDVGVRKIEWRSHMAYARNIADFLARARALTTAGTHQQPGLLSALTARQREFAQHLGRDWHLLLSEAEALGEPACRPPKALLESLSVLPKVGKDEA
ncbi:hypothetical protein ACFV6F_19865 [Kitasatospora phosalacinea]|uniref:hypothetical protein n=1 Tax=Kitasatospora phosalacinea TaxID=2065 RepID=UPI003656FCBA